MDDDTAWLIEVPEEGLDLSFVNILRGESDRGCALVAAAELDNSLAKAIKTRFVGREVVKDEMLKQSGVVGAFSARIDLAYLLGIISENEHRDLHLIRKIRNDFGHVAVALSFETQSIRSRCEELRTVPAPFPTRYRFMMAMAVICGRLLRQEGYVNETLQPQELPVIDILLASVKSSLADQHKREAISRHFGSQLRALLSQRGN